MDITILVSSVLLQFSTAFLAFRLIHRTKEMKAWLFIAIALLLMGARRTITLAETIVSGPTAIDRTAETVSLVVSLLMFMAVWLLGIFFKHLNHLRLTAEANEKLAFENEARLHAVFDAAEGVPIQGYDEDRRVIFWNRASELLYGYSREDALGKKLEDLIIPESIQKHVVEAHRHWLNDGVPIPAGETKRTNENADIVLVYSSHIMVANGDGEKEMFCIDVDLTERKRAENERQRMEKLESLGMVAGGIAHDFNNLLTGVFGNIELAKLELPPEHEASKLLNTAHHALENTRHLTRRLLTFARGGNPILETLDIRTRIRETVKFNLTGSNIAATFDIPDNLWPIKADKGQLDQVVANLTINAKQAMPAGGMLDVHAQNVSNIHEKHAPELRGDFVKITMKDEGIGIPANLIERIFDPYFTTKQKGSGLGLAVIHSIVSKHRGHICVESKPNQGTTFTLFFPVESRQINGANINNTATRHTPAKSSARILIMDDEETVRQATSRMLTRNGYSVETATDGHNALEKYTNAMNHGQSFDLVIMDITIPGGMGGKEAVQELLKLNPDAKVVVISGYSSDPVMANYQDYGFVGCLAKPFEMKILTAEVSRILELN